jgi:hypothetical protein
MHPAWLRAYDAEGAAATAGTAVGSMNAPT